MDCDTVIFFITLITILQMKSCTFFFVLKLSLCELGLLAPHILFYCTNIYLNAEVPTYVDMHIIL